MGLSEGDEEIVIAVRVSLASITFVSCSLLVGTILLFQKYRFLSSRLVLWLSVTSAIQALFYVIPFPEENAFLCDFQAFFSSFCDWAIALWISVIAFNLFLSVVLKKANTLKFEKYFHLVVWGVSTFVAMLPLFEGNVYGDAGGWCWIRPEKIGWRIGTWYGPLLLFFVYVTTMYIWILWKLHSQRSNDEFYQRETEEETRQRIQTAKRLSRYPLIFIILWIFPIINRIENMVSKDTGVFILVLAHGICVSIQGTINSIVYCIDEQILYHCTPSGIKANCKSLLSREVRESQKIQKYPLHTTYESDDKSDIENVAQPLSSRPPRESFDTIPLDD